VKRVCPRCHQLRHLTDHHILPKHVFGLGGHTVEICRECHNELEIQIARLERVILSKFPGAFVILVRQFLKDASIEA